jgi:predicted enzyme related to lactoylglutathione lyase
VADLKRSAEFYKTVFGGEIVSMGDGDAPPYIKIANTWLHHQPRGRPDA